MTDEREKELYETYRNGLLNDTIPFWTTHGYDREYGDWYGYLAHPTTFV